MEKVEKVFLGLVIGLSSTVEVSAKCIVSTSSAPGFYFHKDCNWEGIFILFAVGLLTTAFLLAWFCFCYFAWKNIVCPYYCPVMCLEKKRDDLSTSNNNSLDNYYSAQLYEDINYPANIPPSIEQNQNLAYINDEQPPSHEQPPSFLGEENSLGLPYLRWSHEIHPSVPSYEQPPSAPSYEQHPSAVSYEQPPSAPPYEQHPSHDYEQHPSHDYEQPPSYEEHTCSS